MSTLSARLTQVLTTYCHGLDRGGLLDLATALRDGRYPWLAEEFGDAVTGGAISASDWSTMTGRQRRTGETGEHAVDRDLHRVWSTLFADQPYPSARSGATRGRRTG